MTLPAHPWVARSWDIAAEGHAIRLSRDGIAAWREQGRGRWISQVAPGLALPWRVWEAQHEPDRAELIALLRAPRPLLPLVLAERTDDHGITLSIRVPLELQHFDGHFAGAPVVPGVLHIGWALELAAPRLRLTAPCAHIENLKFQHLLRPGDSAELTLRHDPALHTLHFRCSHGERAYASGRLSVGQAND